MMPTSMKCYLFTREYEKSYLLNLHTFTKIALSRKYCSCVILKDYLAMLRETTANFISLQIDKKNLFSEMLGIFLSIIFQGSVRI